MVCTIVFLPFAVVHWRLATRIIWPVGVQEGLEADSRGDSEMHLRATTNVQGQRSYEIVPATAQQPGTPAPSTGTALHI